MIHNSANNNCPINADPRNESCACVVLTGETAVRYAQLCARIGALRLEAKGLRRGGRSMLAICKEAYKLTGSRARVLDQLEAMRLKMLGEVI